MALRDGLRNGVSDAFEALSLVASLSWHRSLTAWLYVPFGTILILLACFGVDKLIGLSSVSFPASVACLIVLFLGLILIEKVIGERKARGLVSIIDVPAGFTLRYLNIFFTPSFVLLPLSPPIGGVEVGKIIAVFVIGFFVVFAATAYGVRGLQRVLGSSKRALTERAEELGHESDMIPLADSTPRDSSQVAFSDRETTTSPAEDLVSDIAQPRRAQDPSLIRGTGGPPENDSPSETLTHSNHVLQAPLPLTRPQTWAAFININLDRLTYLTLFLFVGLPIYYTTGYALPAHLSLTALTYFTALSLPNSYRKVLHPVLVSSGLTIISVWILGLTRGDSLTTTLTAYKTGTTYLTLFSDPGPVYPIPGAGDILVSVLDAGIVALALPMFSYRNELQRHFFAIVIPNVTVSIGSLFGYPYICHLIGISSTRSLAFAARSLTLALATPAVRNIGGDANTVAALAIMSGILGALIGPQVLDRLKIPEDDYVTRGVTLGGSSSAIATAVLLQSDPRAAALSSLSMSLFGIITLALTSVPVIVRSIDSLVNL